MSIFTPSRTNGRRRCGPTDANSEFGFVAADSSCDLSCDLSETIQADWNTAAAALPNPTVAFAPYPKDAQVSIDESDAFRGCGYSTVDVSYTDLTGSSSTQQKPHCDWEGFTDGKYKNAWNGCDFGDCDEWE